MRVRSRWLPGAASLAFASVVGASGASDQADRLAGRQATSLSLSNGVSVSTGCQTGNSGPAVQHIVFSARSSHTFLGYGVSIEPSKAAKDISGTISILKKLGFVWVKTPLAGADTTPGVSGDVSPAALNADVRERLKTELPDSHKKLFDALHAAGIKVVEVIHRPPQDFFANAEMTKSGKQGRRVKPQEIPTMARYYAAYLAALAELGVRPDLVELINEPNLGRGGKFGPEEYAEFLKTLETEIGGPPYDVNLSAPATASARVPVALGFLEAIQARGALAPLKAITLHTYYVRDRSQGGLPPADDPAFQTIAAMAEKLGVPMISTEFGGTDVKTKLTDPGRESVDTAEEFKAALDLIRNGESAAIVWTLYPNHSARGVENTWALIDANGPTDAYWLFDILAPRIPVGADVLQVQHTDIRPAMTAPGYAAFRSGHHIYLGLSNPAPAQSTATISIDLSALGHYSVTHAGSFAPARAIEKDADLAAGKCPITVSIPSGTGALLDLASSR